MKRTEAVGTTRLARSMRIVVGGLAATTMIAVAMGGCGDDNASSEASSGTTGTTSTNDGGGGNGGNTGGGGNGGNTGGGGNGSGIAKSDWVGDWQGILEDQTNDWFATLNIGIAVNGDGSVDLTIDQGGLNAGRDPDPDTFNVPAADAVLGSPITVFSEIYGLITATFNDDGTFAFTQEVFGLELDVSGNLDLDAGELKGFYQANLLGAFNHNGRATLCDGAPCPDGPMLPPTPDCSFVMPTMGANQACTAACQPPDGACVGGLCLQVCVPNECGDLCQPDEQCIQVEQNGNPLMFPNGKPLGGCSSDGQGPNGLFETCSAGSLCQAGLRCLLFAGNNGICHPPCDGDNDCSPFMSQATGCDFTVQQQAKSYCALRCTPTEDGVTGDAECPTGQSCVPSPGGGNCVQL